MRSPSHVQTDRKPYERGPATGSSKQSDESHPSALTTLFSCYSLMLQGKYAEAEPLYLRSQAIREQALGTEHPEVAVVLNNRALLKESQVRSARTFKGRACGTLWSNNWTKSLRSQVRVEGIFRENRWVQVCW